tara:strand:+ start:79 stop:801 length:723 start_codon:yes stop_codon:yes gene_type:complete
MCEKKTKVCSKCKDEKPITEFNKDKGNKDGHRSNCKVCRRKSQKKHYEDNREKIKARSKKYREENREKVKARRKKYYEENLEKVRASQKKYYEENREKVKARSKKHYEDNQEKEKARSKKYYEDNQEKVKARKKKWKEENPEKRRLHQSKRRARLREAKIEDFSHKDLLDFWNENEINPQECFYCKKEMPEGPEHIDHYIPLIKGGTHERENLRPSCARCNLSKHAKHPEIFMEELKNTL